MVPPGLVEVVAPVVLVVVLALVAGASVVEVVGAVVVVGLVEKVVEEARAGLRPAVAAGRLRGRWLVLVEETGAMRLLGRLVVEEATTGGVAASSAAVPPGAAGAVSSPSRLPPPAPSAMATTSVPHRRSRPNRTHAPARRSLSDA